jgi:molecular chaperone DnaJ
MQFHPDTSGDKECGKINLKKRPKLEVLSDADKKAQYDRYGHAGEVVMVADSVVVE